MSLDITKKESYYFFRSGFLIPNVDVFLKRVKIKGKNCCLPQKAKKEENYGKIGESKINPWKMNEKDIEREKKEQADPHLSKKKLGWETLFF